GLAAPLAGRRGRAERPRILEARDGRDLGGGPLHRSERVQGLEKRHEEDWRDEDLHVTPPSGLVARGPSTFAVGRVNYLDSGGLDIIASGARVAQETRPQHISTPHRKGRDGSIAWLLFDRP